jgi:hypothetical protein
MHSEPTKIHKEVITATNCRNDESDGKQTITSVSLHYRREWASVDAMLASGMHHALGGWVLTTVEYSSLLVW